LPSRRVLGNYLSFLRTHFNCGCSPELVALTEKLLFPDECSVGEGQHGVDTDTFTRSHGVDFTVTTHLGRKIFTIHQSF